MLLVTPEIYKKWIASQLPPSARSAFRARWKLQNDPYIGYWVEDRERCASFYRVNNSGEPFFLTTDTMKRRIARAKKHRVLAAQQDFSMDEMEIAMNVIEGMK